MNDVETLQIQIHDMQAQIAFQEDTIQSLNTALTIQQQDILLMQRKLSVLAEQYRELLSNLDGIKTDNQPPPHY